jgi:hypothetical protein
MTKYILTSLGMLLLAGSPAANALVVTWEMQGTVTNTDGVVPGFGTLMVGDPYVLTWSFDTDAVLVLTREGLQFAPGRRHEFDPSSLVMALQVGEGPSVAFSYNPARSNNSLWLRDNSNDQQVDGQSVDGITFSLGTDDSGGSISAIFRTSDTTVVDGPGLPADPYPAMETFAVSVFGYSRSSEWFVLGDDVAVVRRVGTAVPEPGTLAFFAFALAGLGWTRRKQP